MKSLAISAKNFAPAAAAGLAVLATGLAWAEGTTATADTAIGPAVATVFVPGGLVNPRGLKFGPDGKLYVAEGGYPVDPTVGAPAGQGGLCSAGSGGPGDYFGSTIGSRLSPVDTPSHAGNLFYGVPA